MRLMTADGSPMEAMQKHTQYPNSSSKQCTDPAPSGGIRPAEEGQNGLRLRVQPGRPSVANGAS